jgi:PAS domain S-box-containing protein
MSLNVPFIERRLAREITGRREAERLVEIKSQELFQKNLQLADYSKRLEGALEYNSAILASAPDVILTCDSDLVVENVNDACREVLGYAPDELKGMRLDAIIPVLASGGPTGLHQCEPSQAPLLALTKAGHAIEVELRQKTASVRNRTLHIYFVQDVTTRNNAQRLNEKISRQLHESRRLEAIGALASGIAHEINTPIQFIGENVGFVKNALSDLHAVHLHHKELHAACARDSAYPEEVERVAALDSRIHSEALLSEIASAMTKASEGLALVRDIVVLMRDFAHPGTGEADEADIGAILQSVLTICRNRWKNVAMVEKVLANDLPKILCHTGQIQQVLINLLINAVEAIEEAGQDDGMIRITVAAAEKSIRIRVSDNGPGIPGAVRQKIFDPFFTTKKLGKGTGQGLALARDMIVNHHHGRLYLDEEAGFSTSFVIELPIRSEPAGELAAGPVLR